MSTDTNPVKFYCRLNFNFSSTSPINSLAEMSKASANLKIVASTGPFSARSKALIWLRSVPASSASRSCVSPCCKRNSCNTSPKTVVGNFLSPISEARVPYLIQLVCIQSYAVCCISTSANMIPILCRIIRKEAIKCNHCVGTL